MPYVIQDFKGGEPATPGSLSSWQCPSQDPIVAFELIEEAAKRAGFLDKIAFAADCAASEFYDEKSGLYQFLSKQLALDELLSYYEKLTERFPFLYIEDPVQEDDWNGWQEAKKRLTRTVLIGDDLTVTNIDRLRQAVKADVIGGFIFKPNQVGTVTECLAAQAYAAENGLFSIPSVRAGGSTNDSIVDMAIALGSAAVKHGPPRNGQSIHCINTMLRAEDQNPFAKPFDFSPFVRF
jgi:enolase